LKNKKWNQLNVKQKFITMKEIRSWLVTFMLLVNLAMNILRQRGYIDVVIGLQFGDEGKGKFVDLLTSKYDIVCRFQGGANAGHTVVINGVKYVLHGLPSGVLTAGIVNIIGDGVVIDPVLLVKEIKELERKGICLYNRLKIAKRANLILPTHRALDAANEKALGSQKIGSTLKGIGPTYTDRTARKGLLVGNINSPNFREKYDNLKDAHLQQIASLGFDMQGFQLDGIDFDEYEKLWFESIDYLKDNFEFIECGEYLRKAMRQGKRILAEGAQGVMLDINHGTYPFVTSSNVITAGVSIGLGVSYRHIRKVYGVFKAYCTRVGSGPFNTKQDNEIGQAIRKKGGEFGATTGRNRDCGYLDLPQLQYACEICGVTDLIMMKPDVLDLPGLEEIKVAIGYKFNGTVIDYFPFEGCEQELEPIYETLPGWKGQTITKKRLPKPLKNYVRYIENHINRNSDHRIRVKMVSFGPERDENYWFYWWFYQCNIKRKRWPQGHLFFHYTKKHPKFLIINFSFLIIQQIMNSFQILIIHMSIYLSRSNTWMSKQSLYRTQICSFLK